METRTLTFSIETNLFATEKLKLSTVFSASYFYVKYNLLNNMILSFFLKYLADCYLIHQIGNAQKLIFFLQLRKSFLHSSHHLEYLFSISFVNNSLEK